MQSECSFFALFLLSKCYRNAVQVLTAAGASGFLR
jgi:superfamily I DNA and RNA helicase